MPVPQVGNPVPYGEAPGFDQQARAYNQMRLRQLLDGAVPSGSQGNVGEFGTPNSVGAVFLPEGQNVDDRFINSAYGVNASPSRPPYSMDYNGEITAIQIPLQNGNHRTVRTNISNGMPEYSHDGPYVPHPKPHIEETLRHGYMAQPGEYGAERLDMIPGMNYRPQVEMTTPQSPTPPMPPLPQAPPNPNPFYRRPTPSMGQMMIEPPQFAPQQPDTSAGYVPYGGRF